MTKFWPGTPMNSSVKSKAPDTTEGCWAAGVEESSAPNVRKLSKAKSGKKAKNAGLIPWAFHDAFAASLYHDPDVDATMKGLSESPEQEDKKSLAFKVLRYNR